MTQVFYLQDDETTPVDTRGLCRNYRGTSNISLFGDSLGEWKQCNNYMGLHCRHRVHYRPNEIGHNLSSHDYLNGAQYWQFQLDSRYSLYRRMADFNFVRHGL